VQSLVRKAVCATDQYEQALRQGRSTETGRDARGPLMRRAILQLLCRRGSRPSTDWNQYSKLTRCTPSAQACFSCGRPTFIWFMRMRVACGITRRMISCARCGFIEEAPAKYPQLKFIERNLELHLIGPLPTRGWSAVVLVDPGLEPNERPKRTWCLWPATAEGGPVRSLRMQIAWQPWPMNVTLFLMDGASLVALTHNGRAPRATI
jgi:hypothetical protein